MIQNTEPSSRLPFFTLEVNPDGLKNILNWPHYASILTRGTTSCFHVRLDSGQVKHLTKEVDALFFLVHLQN